ncbi:putative F-box domain-containing protein [Tanacetum coccineum]
MTEFGLDIDEQMLLRMEPHDLIRCKSVCKSWYSLISSDRFVKSQLNYNLRKKADNNEIGDTRITALGATSMCCDDCKKVRSDECQVVGSSNGLVCISRYNTYFLVVNPSTREMKELRNPPKEYYKYVSERVSGFGYDSSIDDYKVVIGFFNECRKLVFKVLTLKSNFWRSVAVELGYDSMFGTGYYCGRMHSRYDYSYRNGILCNGEIHWCMEPNNKEVILSFDLSKEVFKEIPVPKLDGGNWDLGTMKGRLCILDHDFRGSIKIWVMRKYNVHESWEQKLPPRGYNAHKVLMDYFPPKNFFSGHVHIWMLEEGSCAPVLVRSIERPCHELRHLNAHIRLSTNSECNYNYNRHVFVKSLVSPHGMGDGDSNGDGGDGNITDVISLSTLYL